MTELTHGPPELSPNIINAITYLSTMFFTKAAFCSINNLLAVPDITSTPPQLLLL
jgi:hypothetical protein